MVEVRVVTSDLAVRVVTSDLVELVSGVSIPALQADDLKDDDVLIGPEDAVLLESVREVSVMLALPDDFSENALLVVMVDGELKLEERVEGVAELV